MKTLRLGSTGTDVRALQQRLAELGFSPGKVDGKFGPGTEAAVMGFQRGQSLLADGVAGPRTLTALGLMADDTLPSAISQVTTDRVCSMFPETPRRNIQQHLPTVLTGLVEAALEDKPMVLMALATIRAETEGFVPISEGRSRFNTSPNGHPFDLYDKRTDLGNSQTGDGEKYKGRGFIQLTGKANYREHGRAIGMGDDLLNNPELANEPTIAANLLASFLKAKERLIKEALVEHDLRRARRLVNGGSHGLDRFSDCYVRGDRLLKEA